MSKISKLVRFSLAASLLALSAATAYAQEAAPAAVPAAAPAPAAAAPAPAPAAPAAYLKISGHIEAGITANSVAQHQPNALNWGRLFDDKSNAPLLNQAMLTVEHAPDSSAKKVDWGFRVQGVYGSDARYTHALGVFNYSVDSVNQFDLFEANVQAHVPVKFAPGGIDVKAGIYPTLEGVEVMDASGNFFYSHNYIFNFGIPLKHTGVITTTHLKGLDVYMGIDSGVNATFGKLGDANGAAAFHGGFGFNIDKNTTFLFTTHIGPEDARGTPGINPNTALRYLNDITIISKLSPKLTSSTDLNYIRDDGYKVSGGGVSEQLVYAKSDYVSFGLRAEVWDDAQGYFVSAFPGHYDFVLNELGLGSIKTSNGKITANTSVFSNVPTTYGALTLGMNYKFKLKGTLPTKNFGILLRPEVRYDASLGSSKPFTPPLSVGSTTIGRSSQLSFGIDALVSF
jgi:Putative beta-barrel porin-2, OmpL-like. bbp2